jgi:hypothetical protein
MSNRLPWPSIEFIMLGFKDVAFMMFDNLPLHGEANLVSLKALMIFIVPIASLKKSLLIFFCELIFFVNFVFTYCIVVVIDSCEETCNVQEPTKESEM